MSSYWDSILTTRIRRRQALLAGGGMTAGALLLAACGGGGSKESDKSGLLTTPQDTTKQGVAGGVWMNHILSVSDTIEPVAAIGSNGFTHTMPVYSKLAKYGMGRNEELPTTEMITGDAAESWEATPDGLQYTVKLRRNQKFDPRPPTNGR